jgi:DNA-binding Lrp family transcriptional regulator
MTYVAPVDISDPINARILAVSEDKIQGFHAAPLAQIARQSGVDPPAVVERVVGMLRAGTIRRVRQTLMSINLARGALVAWKIAPEKLNAAFDFMFQKDPFSGHIVIRSTDKETIGSQYRLWTTLKVPDGFSMQKHGELLCRITGAESFKLMPARKVFALGVGHVRRRGMPPGSKADAPAVVHDTEYVRLSPLEWRVLTALKREFEPEELAATLQRLPEQFWSARADEAGVSLPQFLEVANSLHDRKVIGRFSTFLEHVKPNAAGERVTTYNALFHWAVPKGREMDAGTQVGRFHIMTHAYWREGGAEFNNVNIMGVVHGTDKQMVLAHKAAIDAHLASPEGGSIPVSYTNVFWGGRSEIKPSEISPFVYEQWCREMGVDPASMRG